MPREEVVIGEKAQSAWREEFAEPKCGGFESAVFNRGRQVIEGVCGNDQIELSVQASRKGQHVGLIKAQVGDARCSPPRVIDRLLRDVQPEHFISVRRQGARQSAEAAAEIQSAPEATPLRQYREDARVFLALISVLPVFTSPWISQLGIKGFEG